MEGAEVPHNSAEIRSFIAIELPEEVREGLARLRSELAKAIEEAAQGISPFHLEISGIGAFPNLKQVRVFWVGISGEVDKLSMLQQNMDSVLGVLGFAKEERSFVPHLTMARIRQGASSSERRSFGDLVGSTIFEDKYRIKVNAISLMRSQLTPAGAIYTRLSAVGLGH
jgi:2'-5' RNA ligase